MGYAQSILTRGPDLSRSRPKLDFGRGFYVTTRQAHAARWAARVADAKGEQPAVLSWNVKYDDFDRWPKIVFAEAGKSADEYWTFVTMNRKIQGSHRSSPSGYFHVVVGPASNNYVDREPVDDLDQISFHTSHGLSLLVQSSPALYSLPFRVVI